MPGDDLGAAAGEALAAAGDEPVVDNEHGQTVITPAWRSKFLGATYDAITTEDLPGMDEERWFLVQGRVTKEGRERRKDGELRVVRAFETLEVTPVTAAELELILAHRREQKATRAS